MLFDGSENLKSIESIRKRTNFKLTIHLAEYNRQGLKRLLFFLTVKSGEFDWDPQLQGLVLGAFFYGYVITQIPGGLIAEKYGAKWLYGAGMLLTTIFTLLTPIAARWSVWALVVARVIEGIGEGVTYPAINTLIGQWAPKLERSRFNAFIYTGSNIGTVFTLTISGILCDSNFLGGWPSVFYVFGASGCFWLILWTFLVFDTPDSHPRISRDELLYIRQSQDKPRIRPPTPWKSILTSMPFWALLVTHVGESWGFYTLIIQMPMYLSKILHYDINQNGALSALPSLMLSIVSILSSILADKLRAEGKWRITAIRKILNSIDLYIFILVNFNQVPAGWRGGDFIWNNKLFSNFTGFLVPAFVGWIIEDGQTVRNWGIVFVTAAVILLVTGVIYDIFCSAESQPWGLREIEHPLEKKPLDKEDEPSHYNHNMDSSKI
ncbi:putative inorganic phosphate cotransporter [Trichonephila inaurata madagascariensis]|uniref:Putative inorganic phosphate cotransporter n=1 Tax=Trichonephila inaurata madagascariensis TaxID=2747483 RepID=A0A8X6I9L0_9ARAC|nr:putative inorganic phosphate cotransporter [Trichonephila inaurata madagascariensis]